MCEMKDSGIEGAGIIPSFWKTTRLSYECYIRARLGWRGLKADEYVEEGYAFISAFNIQNGNLVWKPLNFISKERFNESPEIKIQVGDVLIVKDGAGVGKCARVDELPIGGTAPNSSIAVITPNENQDYRYVCYYLQSSVFNNFVLLLYNGMGVPHLTQEVMSKIKLLMPPLSEQQKISAHLDRKCSEIDALLAEIQNEIRILEEYKHSVITEAVTKGLNPNVEMKDSGVEWIGEIPKHWKVDNPKWHFIQRKDRAAYGLTQLTASQKYGVVTQDEYMEITGAKIVTVEKDFDILKLVCPGDFIIHMRSFQGGLEYSEKYGSISSAYVMLIPQKTIFEPRYYKWFFKSSVYIDALSSTSNLIRDGQAMRYANFIQLPILLMPKDEQRQIADYLDSKIKEINTIISEKRQQIATIEEYKKSLIFEYVTGKREV